MRLIASRPAHIGPAAPTPNTTSMDEPSRLKAQAQKARRLAGFINDQQARKSLNDLADEYDRQCSDGVVPPAASMNDNGEGQQSAG